VKQSGIYEFESVHRVLLVDDDDVDRIAVRRVLSRTSLSIDLHEAREAVEAIEMLRDQAFDCVFLDYQLPGWDGLEFVNAIRAEGFQVALVVLTGQGDEQIAVDLMKAGVTDYCTKARMSPATLEQLIRNAIRVHRAELQAAIAHRQLQERNELLLKQNQELERQRQQIELQNLKLVEASRLKSQFLATMSHELRTPMHAIIGFAELLLRSNQDSLSSRQRDMVERTLSNGKHLLTLLNEILDLSKVESGRLKLKPESFNLVETIHITVAELRPLADHKHLPIHVKVDLKNSHIFHDPNRVRQILVNLLSNAIKFTDQGGITITVRQPDPNQVAIAVQDTGIGIPPENLVHIFEPFRQGDQSTTRAHKGTGLGLAIVHSLVKMMNGNITVHSQVNQGTEFCVVLPTQQEMERSALISAMSTDTCQ
jgi:signal transduction histidine kinase